MLSVDNIRISYGETPVISGLSFDVSPGEIACLLGASGCGKTSILRAIAGFQEISAGELSLSGTLLSRAGMQQPPEQRGIGMVFQDNALFPHLTVAANIRFGLSKLSRPEQDERLAEMLLLTRLCELADRYPHQLSGGQQQRVALARALATRPALLLFDEPFSNLDADLRNQLALEVRDILKSRGTSAILVTHDQAEAFTFADRVGVIHDGILQQWDSPHNLYQRPANALVATFIGRGSMIDGVVTAPQSIETELGDINLSLATELVPGTPVAVLLRPEDSIPDLSSPVSAMIVSKEFSGNATYYKLRLNSGALIDSSLNWAHNFNPGEEINLRLNTAEPPVFERS